MDLLFLADAKVHVSIMTVTMAIEMFILSEVLGWLFNIMSRCSGVPTRARITKLCN